MNAVALIAILLAAAATGAFAWAFMGWQRARSELAASIHRLELMEESRNTMGELVRAQAGDTARAVADQLVTRATETFQAQDRLARERMEAQLKPVAEQLTKFQEPVAALEKSRVEDTGGLKAQIAALMQASVETQGEARKLSAALRRGAGVQGRWGEQTLRNVLEAAGLANRFDFEEQFSLDTEEGRRRPDVKVRMPGGGVFAIGAKASLNAFLEAQECPDDATRDQWPIGTSSRPRVHPTSWLCSCPATAFWPPPWNDSRS